MVSLNLNKNESLDLHKAVANLKKVNVALGWKANDGNGGDFDVDATAFLLDSNGKVYNGIKCVVFYNANAENINPAVKHSGDDKSGSKVANVDCETIEVDFSRMDPMCERIDFIMTIYVNEDTGEGKNLTFRNITNAFVRIYDKETGKEICRFDLSSDYGTSNSVMVGSLLKNGSNWSFRAIGSGEANADLNTYFHRYQNA